MCKFPRFPPFSGQLQGLRNEGKDKKMETTLVVYIRTSTRIHSFIPGSNQRQNHRACGAE